jgi:hypothetical protein
MSRCGLVCFGMQVHGSTPGDSQRVEDVATYRHRARPESPTGNVSEGRIATFGRRAERRQEAGFAVCDAPICPAAKTIG